jgi:hypothetical protein
VVRIPQDRRTLQLVAAAVVFVAAVVAGALVAVIQDAGARPADDLS